MAYRIPCTAAEVFAVTRAFQPSKDTHARACRYGDMHLRREIATFPRGDAVVKGRTRVVIRGVARRLRRVKGQCRIHKSEQLKSSPFAHRPCEPRAGMPMILTKHRYLIYSAFSTSVPLICKIYIRIFLTKRIFQRNVDYCERFLFSFKAQQKHI